MDLLAGEADILNGGDVTDENISPALSAVPLDLAPLLRRVALVGEPALGGLVVQI